MGFSTPSEPTPNPNHPGYPNIYPNPNPNFYPNPKV